MEHAMISIEGVPGRTFQMTASDVSQSIPASAHKSRALSAWITCETNDVRVALGGIAPTASLGHVLYAGQSLRVAGVEAVKSFSFINDTAGSNGVLHITCFFEA